MSSSKGGGGGKNNPKISVIIPIYNTEKYLRECLDSVINQTLKDIEIICINDGSTDDSSNILKEYEKKDSRIKVLSQKNSGQGAARNKGLEIAKGEYITFADSDDYLLPNFCKTLYEAISQNDTDIAVSCVENFIDGKEQNEEKLLSLKERFDKSYFNVLVPAGRWEYDFNNFQKLRVGPVAKLYKKEIIDKFDIKFPEGYQQEDEAFYWFYMIRIQSLFSLEEKLYYRRMHQESVMYNTEINYKKLADFLHILEIVHTFLKRNKLLKKYEKKYINQLKGVINDRERKIQTISDKKVRSEIEKTIKRLKYKTGILKHISKENICEKSGRVHKVFNVGGVKFKFRNKEKELDFLRTQNMELNKKTRQLEKRVSFLESMFDKINKTDNF